MVSQKCFPCPFMVEVSVTFFSPRVDEHDYAITVLKQIINTQCDDPGTIRNQIKLRKNGLHTAT